MKWRTTCAALVGIFLGSVPVLGAHVPTSNTDGTNAHIDSSLLAPAHTIPSPAYAPWPEGDPLASLVTNRFQMQLNKVTGRQAREVRLLEPPPTSHLVHLSDMRRQLERNDAEPVLYLGSPPSVKGQLYAYILEATPDMSSTFGSFDPDRIRWSVLEVVPGSTPRMHVRTYMEASPLDLVHVRGKMIEKLGRNTVQLGDTLRRVLE